MLQMRTKIGEMEQELASLKADNDRVEQEVIHARNMKIEIESRYGLQCAEKEEKYTRGVDELHSKIKQKG